MKSKMKHRQKLTSITFTDKDDIQQHLLQLETILLDLARLCDSITERERTVTSVRTLSESPMAITLLADAKNLEYDQMAP